MLRVLGVAGALLAGIVAACGGDATTLTIRAQGEDPQGETVSLSRVTFDLIPYDIDELHEELESQTQAGPPPQADTLRALAGQLEAVCAAHRAIGDSLEPARQAATQIASSQGETSDAYRLALAQYDSLVAREEAGSEQCQQVTEQYTQERNAYRGARRSWEEMAWPVEQFNAAESLRAGGLEAQRVETDENGTAVVTVPNGTWWIVGETPVPGSITQQYRWNIRVEAIGGDQTIELTSGNAELVPVF